jgi:hypothetical protein
MREALRFATSSWRRGNFCRRSCICQRITARGAGHRKGQRALRFCSSAATQHEAARAAASDGAVARLEPGPLSVQRDMCLPPYNSRSWASPPNLLAISKRVLQLTVQ